MGAKVGHIVTPETREKTRLANLGRVLSTQTKDKIRRSMRGRHLTLETRTKMSLSRRGHVVTPETRAKIARAHMGIPMPDSLKERLRIISMTRVCTPETRCKLSLAGQGRKHTSESKTKISQSRKGIIFTKQQRAKIGAKKKSNWQNPELRDKMVRQQRLGALVHPNRAGATVLSILESRYPSEWAFVGDGSIVIGGKNPDFANVNGQKKLIELFGDYWHAEENPQERIDIFKRYGFDTLIVWEHELKTPELAARRIAEFCGIKSSLRISEN